MYAYKGKFIKEISESQQKGHFKIENCLVNLNEFSAPTAHSLFSSMVTYLL